MRLVGEFFDSFKNELFAVFKDPATLLIMVIAVLLYGLMYSLPYSNAVLRDIDIAVLDYDNSELSREFARELDSNENLRVKIRSADPNMVEENFEEGEILSYLIIPRDFEKDLKSSKPVNIALYTDSAYLLIYRSVANGLITVANTFGAKVETGKLIKRGKSKGQTMVSVQPFEFVSIPLFNHQGSYFAYIFPIVLVLILQQTMLVGVGLLEGSRAEAGKTEEVGKSRLMTVLGKGLAHASIYLAHGVVYFLIFPMIYGYGLNFNIPLLFLLLLIYLMSVSFMAQAIAYFFKKREHAFLALVVTSMPILFGAGFVWPKEAIPSWINLFALIFPSTAGANAIIKINQMGAGFSDLIFDFCILTTLCIFYFAIACKIGKTGANTDISPRAM